ncbi:MAG: hypothetical protein OHK0052_17510 [Anaerolineales bacterium]
MPSLLETIPPISRIRRNHGLEHATLHILARQFPQVNMAGYSNTQGFWIFGNVPTEALRSAAQEALQRMKNGEAGLAVHPYCGTNFLANGFLAGTAGAFAMWNAKNDWRDRLERLSLATSLATLALILGQPLGFALQKHITTSGQPGTLQIVDIHIESPARHRIITRD